MVACTYGCDDDTIEPTRCAGIDAGLGDRCRQRRACSRPPAGAGSAHSALAAALRPALTAAPGESPQARVVLQTWREMKNNTLSIKAIGVTISTFAPLPPGAPKTCSDTWCIAVEECRDRPYTGPDACQSRVGHQACRAGVDRSLWCTPWLPPEVERVSCTRSVQRASSLIACSSASTLSRATTEVGQSPPAAGRIPGRPAWQPGRSLPAAPRYAPGTGAATGWGGLLHVGMCGRTYRGDQPRACA